MAKVFRYLAPYAPGYSNQERREAMHKSYRRVTKKSLQNAGMQYSMSRGYYNNEDNEWGPLPKKPETKKLRLANGRLVTVTDSTGSGYEYNAILKDEELAEYIDTANFKYAIDGCGHIARLEYAPYRMMMRVTFQQQEYDGHIWGRDDTAIYFRVPSTVFGELYWLAESKSTQGYNDNGSPRHVLGIRFWDIVRVRGSRVAGKFPYTVEHGRALASKTKPVSEYKRQSDIAMSQSPDKEDAAINLDASRAAQRNMMQQRREMFNREQRQADSYAVAQKNAALASLFGSEKNAHDTLDMYANSRLSKRAQSAYASLSSLLDKHNFLVKEGIIDDFTEE